MEGRSSTNLGYVSVSWVYMGTLLYQASRYRIFEGADQTLYTFLKRVYFFKSPFFNVNNRILKNYCPAKQYIINSHFSLT